VNAAWLDAITRSGLSSTERWVLVAWLRRVGESGEGAVAIADLVMDTGFGKRTVRRALRVLRNRRVLDEPGRTQDGHLRLRLEVAVLVHHDRG